MSLTNLLASLKGGKILIPVLQDFISRQNRHLSNGLISKRDIALRDAKLTIRAMNRRVKEFQHGVDIDGDFFHPSALGVCQRALWLSNFKAPISHRPKEDELRSYLIFEIGTAIHVVIQNLCKRAGIMVRPEAVIKDERRKIIGHADGILRIQENEYILEIKSINSRGFTLLGKSPQMAHKQQAHAYMKSLGLDWAIILYYDKDRSQLKEYVVQFDPEFYLKHCKQRIRKYFRHVTERTLPDREGESPGKFPCSFCAHADICYSQGPLKKFVRKVQNEG